MVTAGKEPDLKGIKHLDKENSIWLTQTEKADHLEDNGFFLGELDLKGPTSLLPYFGL